MRLALLLAVLLFATLADAGIKRSRSAKMEFKQQKPCPAIGARKGPCKGHVIDQSSCSPVADADEPSNMQWQTVAEGETKDSGCERGAGNTQAG